jgi:peptide/nickel transport system substrate-binding protein
MTDIVGSTEHAAELGDSAWRVLLQQHHALMRAELRRHGGREMDTAGDGFFVVFDAPAAAIACVLAMAEGVRRLGLDIRAGVHVGEVQQMARKVTGITVVIASRIMAGAGAGEVLVSSTVSDLTAGSGLRFDDRGVHSLKGVPGEWHVYAVRAPETEAVETGPRAGRARERRAAAVRRAQARPIWQRRPRLAAGTALGLALVIATSGLLIWKPWQPAALASLTENAVGIIDPDRGELIDQIEVGTQPGGIAVGGGYAWVTNTGADTVSQIDLATRSAVNRIPVGRAPTGIVVAKGSVWVTNSGERSVSRLNATTGDVVEATDVGNGPIAIAASGNGLWVVNTTDSTVRRLDAGTGELGEPIGVAATPVALTADADELWVASEFVSAVSQLDPETGETIESIPLPGRPSAVALDAGSLWVAAADGTVTRIDRDTHIVTQTIPLGGHLNAIAITDDSVWVGDRDGYVYRVSTSDDSAAPVNTATLSSVAALAVVNDDIWVAAQASVSSHRGGTLRILLPERNDTDPLGLTANNTATLVADGLVGFRRVGGVAGGTLLPDLATAIPLPTDDGLTYSFQLRPNLVYSNGQPVRPADFRRAIERSFQIETPFVGVSGSLFFQSIVGTEPCVPKEGRLVERCDLSKGIVADEAKNTVTFHLREPDPDFLLKMATLYAYPVREGVPMHGLALDGSTDSSFLGTGPYVVATSSDSEVRLERNPRFEVWDPAVRPDGFPNEIVYRFVADDAERLAMVENEEADYLHVGRPEPDLFQGSQAQYGGQWHIGSTVTTAVWINTAIPPFDHVRVRQALNLAIDRAHMAGVYGGPPLVAITCQVISPGFPGYRPYCPYTRDADDAGGHWRGPDLAEALQLVEESGTKGDRVLVGPSFDSYAKERDYVGKVLEDLGYAVHIDKDSEGDHIGEVGGAGDISIWPVGWGPDYLAPSIFFSNFTCESGRDPFSLIRFCKKAFDRAYEKALHLQATNPSAAWDAWAEVDEMAVDLALWAPLYNPGGDFVSARVGNYQFSPTGWVLFDQMWVQTAEPGSVTSPSPVASPPTATPTAGPPSPLERTWATGATTCTEQNAAVEEAGFTAEQMAIAGWTCIAGRPPESQFTVIFEAGRLLQYSDGYLGWSGQYRIVDEDTFEAGDDGSYYITYDYAIDGDRLTIDMIQDTCPPCAPGDLLGERIALTVIFESSRFTREP